MTSAARSQFRQCIAPFALRAYLAEFISTFLFVFAAVGSIISARMLTPDVTSESSSLVATAIAQGFALFVAVYIAADISGGHCNPAVTFAMAVGGHIAIPSAICYGISQMLGSTFACLVLRVASAGQAIPTTRLAILMTGFGGAVLESVITFMLVYTVFVAADPRLGGDNSKRGPAAALGPLAIGMVEGALVMAVGSLTGGSMNPARSFGPSVVSGDFKNHGVYWAGPLIGAAMAALVHQNVVFSSVASSEGESSQVVEETVLVAETVMV